MNKRNILIGLVLLGVFISFVSAQSWDRVASNQMRESYLNYPFGQGSTPPTNVWNLGAAWGSFGAEGIMVGTTQGTFLLVPTNPIKAYNFATHALVWTANIPGYPYTSYILAADSNSVWIQATVGGGSPSEKIVRLNTLTGAIQATSTPVRCVSAAVGPSYAYCVAENTITRLDKMALTELSHRDITTRYFDSYLWNTGGLAISSDGSRVCTVSENVRQIQGVTISFLSCFNADLSAAIGPVDGYSVPSNDLVFRGWDHSIIMGPDVIMWFGGGTSGNKEIHVIKISTYAERIFMTGTSDNNIQMAIDDQSYYILDGGVLSAYLISNIGAAEAPTWQTSVNGLDSASHMAVAQDKIILRFEVLSNAGVILYGFNPSIFNPSLGTYNGRLFLMGMESTSNGNFAVYDAGRSTADPVQWNPFTGDMLNDGKAGVAPSTWGLSASWVHRLGYPVYAPVIVGDNVYVLDTNGPSSGECEVWKYDLATGNQIWSSPYRFICMNYPAVTVDDGLVAMVSDSDLFVIDDSGALFCDKDLNDLTVSASPLIIPGSNLIVVGTESGWRGIRYDKGAHTCTDLWTVPCGSSCSGHSCTAGGSADGKIAGFDRTNIYLPCIARDTSFPHASPYGTQAQLKVVNPANGGVTWTWYDNSFWGSPATRVYDSPIIDVPNQRVYMGLWNPDLFGKITAINMGSSHNTIWDAVLSGTLDSLDYGFSYGNSRICAVQSDRTACYDTSGNLKIEQNIPALWQHPAISGNDLCIGEYDGFSCWNMLGSSFSRDFFTNQPGSQGNAGAIANSPSNPNTYNIVYTDQDGYIRRYTGVISGVTTSSTTTTTTLPGGQYCYTIQDYDTGSYLNGVFVGMSDQTTPHLYSCTTAGSGSCCISSSVSDQYEIDVVGSDAYDNLILPAESPDPTGTEIIAMKNYPSSSPTSLLIKLRKISDADTYCRSDIPFYRMACWTTNPHPQSSTPITFSLFSSMDNYIASIYTGSFSTTTDSRLSIYFNRLGCDYNLVWDYFVDEPPCIKSYADAAFILGNRECDLSVNQRAPYPVPCDPSKLFRTVDWTKGITNPPSINYKLQVRYDTSSKYSTAAQLYECYQDSDCSTYWSLAWGPSALYCDTISHSCSKGAQWMVFLPSYTTYSNDRPVMNVQFTAPSICKPNSMPGCDRFDLSVLRYKIYRSVAGTFSSSSAITDYIPYPSDGVFHDDFHDICPIGSSPPQCTNVIGSSYYYGVEAFYPVSGGYSSDGGVLSMTSPITVDNCDPSIAAKKCSKLACLAPGGKGCGSFVECGQTKPCSSDTECIGCQTINGNGLISNTFCYLPLGQCKPIYKGCAIPADCAGDDVGVTSDIWNRNPTGRYSCTTSGALTMYCNKERNAVLSTQAWSTSGDFSYSNQYGGAFCECKITAGDVLGVLCTESNQCQSGNCAFGGVVANPPNCQWTNLKNNQDGNVKSCFISNAPTNHVCYNSNPSLSSGNCFAIGSCGLAESIPCDISDPTRDDVYCRNTIFARTGQNEDKFNAFCEERLGSTQGFCLPASQRKECSQNCLRNAWCGVALTCQGVSYPGYGTCYQAGATCPTTTTLLPIGKTCTLDAQNCQNSQSYAVGVEGMKKTFYVVWRDITYGTTVVKVPCLDGRGCPIANTLDNGPETDPNTGEYLYSACGCAKEDGSEFDLMNKYICVSSSVASGGSCVPLLQDTYACDGKSASTAGFPAGYSGDRVCASFNCIGDSYTSVSGSTVVPQCASWNRQCDANAVKSTPDAQLQDPEHYCHIEVGSADVNGVHTWLGGPDDSPGGALIWKNYNDAKANIKSNSQYCYDEGRTHQETPDFKCHETKSDGGDCSYDYECKSQNCYQYTCVNPNSKKGINQQCIIYNQQNDMQPDLVWNSLNNGESTSSSAVWTDNCDRSNADTGPLYCDPCNQQLDQTDDGSSDNPVTKCEGLQIKNLAGGICYHAQKNGQWCYNNGQCDQSVGTNNKMLYCGGISSCDKGKGQGVTDVATSDGNWINNYCGPSNSLTFNHHCVYADVGQCYHDYVLTGGSADKFDQQQDEVCWRLQHLPGGNLPSSEDMFCNDNDMCKHSGEDDSLAKNCETFSIDDRIGGKVVHVMGSCVKDYCPKETASYLSSACMRAPLYSTTVNSHHVADAGNSLDLSLVYCDGVGGKAGSIDQGGMCKWRKDLSASCSNKYECKAEYSCVSGICQSLSCKSDSDCEAGQFCDSGTCHIKPTYAINIYALNGESKPNPDTNEFKDAYDFVVSCNKADYVFKYVSDTAIRMKYKVGATDEQWFGNTENALVGTATGPIDLCKLNPGLDANMLNPSHIVYDVTFIPIIDGVEQPKLISPKKILVLSRSLSLNVFRCDDQHMLTESVCKGGFKSGGKPYDKDTFIIKMNNTIATGQQGTSVATFVNDPRTIKCYGSMLTNGQYPNVIPPRTSDDENKGVWHGASAAVIENWATNKYFRCYDMYGSINEGTLIFNPAEALFNYQFDPRQQLFWILLVLIGIPTLVLAGSRARGR